MMVVRRAGKAHPIRRRLIEPAVPRRQNFNIEPHLARCHSIHEPLRRPASAMPVLATSARAIARSWTAHQLPVARAGCTALQTRSASASSFDSPFKTGPDTTKIPSFAAYRNKGGETGPKIFQYFMVGTMGALSAVGAKATVQGTLSATRAWEMTGNPRTWQLGVVGSCQRPIGYFGDDVALLFDAEAMD